MASFLSDLLTSGWSTSKPGDMKNPSGMALRQFGAAAASAAAATASTSSAMASLNAALKSVDPDGFAHIEALSKVSVDPEADKPQTSEDAW